MFDGFVQFQTKYVTNEACMQEIFSMYIETRSQISFIELYIEFEQSEADQNIELEDYNSDSKEKFESNYEVVDPGEDEDQADSTMETNVMEVANALANQHPFEEPTFMCSLDLEVTHAPEFSQYINTEKLFTVVDGEFTVGMKFSLREAVIKAMKDYTIRRSVDYRVYESEPMRFYAKCTQYGVDRDWLIRVRKMCKKYCWEIKRYNGSYTCTRATISQDHSKLNFNTIAEAINPLFKAPYLQKLIVNIGYLWTVRRQNKVFKVREMSNKVEYQLDWQVYVHDVYKMDQVRRVYKVRFRPLVNPTTRPIYHGPRLIGNPFLRRVAKGRSRWTLGCCVVQVDVSNAVPRATTIVDVVNVVVQVQVQPPNRSTRDALHNDLYKCARHADLQLNCMILGKLRSNDRNF
ncbi:hypothetical protein Ahy_B08g092788 [Arachis hypogaea]|uniref:Uncharacterized protein n=1 Tax=Arachis hypogaea TaxID=3818 RepID=A0A444Y4N9_ARAHY|nr:hypothetical protein Ahy_B08g092788 [Arachis hypogaea]